MSLELEATVRDRGVEAALSVADGETVAVLGPNGSGKSTLLSVVAGPGPPGAGRVVLDGRELTVAGERCARCTSRRTTGVRRCSARTRCSSRT